MATDEPDHVVTFPDGSEHALRSAETAASLRETFRVDEGGGTFAEAREHAGLSVGQAAALSGIPSARLREIEAEPDSVTAQAWFMLATLYDVNGFATPCPSGTVVDVIQCGHCRALSLAGDAPRHTGQCGMLREIAARSRGTR